MMAAALAEGHISCSTCGQTVTFPRGAAMVRCPTCGDVLIIRRTGKSGGEGELRGTHVGASAPALVFLLGAHEENTSEATLSKRAAGAPCPSRLPVVGGCGRQGGAQGSHRSIHSLTAAGAPCVVLRCQSCRMTGDFVQSLLPGCPPPPVPTDSGQETGGQGVCGGCRMILLYQMGIQLVSCSFCGSVTLLPRPESFQCRYVIASFLC